MSSSFRKSSISRRAVLGGMGAGGAAAFLAACAGPGSGGAGSGLTQWYHQYGEAGTEDAARRYAAAYTEQTVTVNWVSGDYGTTLSSRLISGEGLDVFENNGINVTDAREGRYYDFTSVIEPLADQFSEAALRPVTIDGKYWGIPMIVDPQLFYYSKSAFEAAGLSVPETLEDLYDAAKALTDGDQRGIFIDNTNGGASLTGQMAWAAGGAVLNDDNATSGFGSEAIAEGFSIFRKMYTENLQLQGQPSDWWDITPFANGVVPIQWGGMWSMPQALAALGDDVGVFPFPAVGSAGVPVVSVGGWNEQVAAASANVDAAAAFAEWLWIDQVEFQEDWSLSYGFHIPPLAETAAAATKLQEGATADVVSLTDEFAKAGNPFWTADINSTASDAAVRIIIDGADPVAEVTAAAEAITTAAAALQ